MIGDSGLMFLLIPAHPGGSRGQMAVKRLFVLLLYLEEGK